MKRQLSISVTSGEDQATFVTTKGNEFSESHLLEKASLFLSSGQSAYGDELIRTQVRLLVMSARLSCSTDEQFADAIVYGIDTCAGGDADELNGMVKEVIAAIELRLKARCEEMLSHDKRAEERTSQ